jgi:hypothetical protein
VSIDQTTFASGANTGPGWAYTPPTHSGSPCVN